MRFSNTMILVLAVLHVSTASAQTPPPSTLGAPIGMLEPAGWDVGDAGSTHQFWDRLTASNTNLPDRGYNTAGATLTSPTLAAHSPGYGPTAAFNFYAFMGDYGSTAAIYSHGTSGAGLGTHVIVQIGASLNPEQESFPGSNHGTGVYLNSLALLNPANNNPLTGGANIDKLQVAELSYDDSIFTSFGDVEYQEVIYEFWLPGYTGDFRVDWDLKVHSSMDTLRVDTMIAPAAVGGGSPFSLTGVEPTDTGDFNGDEVVNALDYIVWRMTPDAFGGPLGYTDWAANFGNSYNIGTGGSANSTVPEPTTSTLLILAASFWVRRRR